MPSSRASVIGILGAGTMGAGIAQLAAQSGARTLVHDPVPEALERGLDGIGKVLDRLAEKGKVTPEDASAARGRIESAADLAALADCELVIEAAPERLELKQEMFGRLAREVVGPQCVLATNTSSLSVTAIAAAVDGPERVVGMHFFNPAPVMRLLEVVAGEASSKRAVDLAYATGEAMGKHVIVAADVAGFLVNRCNRPFGLEGLRLLQERIADVETIDRIARLQGGFRMGPFELMDLVGVDVGFEVSQSFYAQSFGEPRWRPSTITSRYVAAGYHGRKSGRGYYDYSSGEHRPPDRDPPAGGGGDGLVVIAGDTVVGGELLDAAGAAGWDARHPTEAADEVPWLIVDCGHDPAEGPLQGGPMAMLLHEGSLAALDAGGGAVGFHVLPPLPSAGLVELTRGAHGTDAAAERVERFFATLGKHTEWVGDAPGLVLGRMMCQVVNECAFAVGEGVGSPEDVDAGLELGVNHPRGALRWADAIGLDHVLAVLDALYDEYREERYRAAPLLRRMVLEGRLGDHAGGGFHS